MRNSEVNGTTEIAFSLAILSSCRKEAFLLTLALVLTCLGASGQNVSELTAHYWPSFPLPDRVVLGESHNGVSEAVRVVLNTVSGLAAYDARSKGSGEMVWIGLTNSPSYDTWLEAYLKRTGVACDKRVLTSWELVDRYREQGLAQGYILYRREPGERALYAGDSSDTSANVATSLCALLGGVAVEESIEADAKAHGLSMLLDVRGRDEAWLFNHYGNRLSVSVLGRQDPKSGVNRDAIVAMRAPVIGESGTLYERMLERLRPGSPLLGWGIGLEDAQTGPASEYASFQTATNWCANLPLLSSGETGLNYGFKPFAAPPDRNTMPEDGIRYVSFILSDGDNVQWLMLNFCKGEEAQQYWASPARGTIPFGWTMCAMDLLQLCPYTLDYLRDTATPKDDFLLLGGGYYYPDWFGRKRSGADWLAMQARRTAKDMDACGVNLLMVNVQKWDSPEAARAYETYAREMPNLRGLFVIQYAPYTGGGGTIRWVNGLPVITARNAIWGGRGEYPREGTPNRVARLLNEWAAQPVRCEEDRFAWVIVHAWSWFREAEFDAPLQTEETDPKDAQPRDASRGYSPAVWAARHLSPAIRVVTPYALIEVLRKVHAKQP